MHKAAANKRSQLKLGTETANWLTWGYNRAAHSDPEPARREIRQAIEVGAGQQHSNRSAIEAIGELRRVYGRTYPMDW